MARLIDADRLAKVVEDMADYPWNAKAAPGSWRAAFEEFLDYIDDAPTVDAVEVVRCKDCKYWERPKIGTGTCDRMMGDQFGYCDTYDFCRCGVRRESDGN